MKCIFMYVFPFPYYTNLGCVLVPFNGNIIEMDLGIWYAMKVLKRDGDIITVKYNAFPRPEQVNIRG